MTDWRPQSYKQAGKERKIPEEILEHAIAVGNRITAVDHRLPPIFSLAHLSYLTDVSYGLLRSVVARSHHEQDYSVFRIGKRPSGQSRGYRTICIPSPGLLVVQR